jgi:hypothetical protein
MKDDEGLDDAGLAWKARTAVSVVFPRLKNSGLLDSAPVLSIGSSAPGRS